MPQLVCHSLRLAIQLEAKPTSSTLPVAEGAASDGAENTFSSISSSSSLSSAYSSSIAADRPQELQQRPSLPLCDLEFRMGRSGLRNSSSNNQIIINHSRVSKKHAILRRHGLSNTWSLEDTSSNGTLRNGQGFSQETVSIFDQDIITIVGFECIFYESDLINSPPAVGNSNNNSSSGDSQNTNVIVVNNPAFANYTLVTTFPHVVEVPHHFNTSYFSGAQGYYGSSYNSPNAASGFLENTLSPPFSITVLR